MKRIFLLLTIVLFSLVACSSETKTTAKIKSSVKTVGDIMAEADKNHGGNVTSADDKNNPYNNGGVVPNTPAPLPNGSNLTMGGSNLVAPNANAKKQSDTLNASDIDIDLTKLSSTMVYSEVYNMMYTPENYVGKMVRMNGTFNVYEYPERNYYTCIIKDATACCQQGLEFVLKDKKEYPKDYPKTGTNIIVTGIFDIYYEGEQKYCQLKDARLVKGRA